jgi:hypothetical protein
MVDSLWELFVAWLIVAVRAAPQVTLTAITITSIPFSSPLIGREELSHHFGLPAFDFGAVSFEFFQHPRLLGFDFVAAPFEILHDPLLLGFDSLHFSLQFTVHSLDPLTLFGRQVLAARRLARSSAK